MKRVNLELKALALDKAKIQLNNLKSQLEALQAKVEFVSNRYTAKLEEISQIETVLVSSQTDTTVSK